MIDEFIVNLLLLKSNVAFLSSNCILKINALEVIETAGKRKLLVSLVFQQVTLWLCNLHQFYWHTQELANCLDVLETSVVRQDAGICLI
jgi:hypothetical protein